MEPENIVLRQVDQLTNVPSVPGIYCWLARPDLSESSWERRSDQSEGDATSALISELKSFMDATQLHDVDSEVTAFFDTKWSGNLTYKAEPRQAGTPARKTALYCKDENSRRLLVELLLWSFPAFWQPLYIGVATSLKQRLSTHERVLSALINHQDVDHLFRGMSADDLNAAKTLGERLNSCGYAPEHLWVAILPIRTLPDGIDKKRRA